MVVVLACMCAMRHSSAMHCVFGMGCRDTHGLQRHPTVRAVAGLCLAHLRMHWTGVPIRCMRGMCSVGMSLMRLANH